jgi:hypothetical protein
MVQGPSHHAGVYLVWWEEPRSTSEAPSRSRSLAIRLVARRGPCVHGGSGDLPRAAARAASCSACSLPSVYPGTFSGLLTPPRGSPGVSARGAGSWHLALVYPACSLVVEPAQPGGCGTFSPSLASLYGDYVGLAVLPLRLVLHASLTLAASALQRCHPGMLPGWACSQVPTTPSSRGGLPAGPACIQVTLEPPSGSRRGVLPGASGGGGGVPSAFPSYSIVNQPVLCTGCIMNSLCVSSTEGQKSDMGNWVPSFGGVWLLWRMGVCPGGWP